jgi:hypothetical protein
LELGPQLKSVFCSAEIGVWYSRSRSPVLTGAQAAKTAIQQLKVSILVMIGLVILMHISRKGLLYVILPAML